MKRFLLVILVGAFFPACEKSAEPPQANVVAEAAVEVPNKPSLVAVAPDGTKFDPPVPVDQFPADAWMCVMGGKVHYARTEPGDKKCVTCGMALVQADGGSGGHGDHDGHGDHHH